MLGVPPNTLPLVIYIGIFCYWVNYYITTCHSKQLPVGLMVLSDGNYLVALSSYNRTPFHKMLLGYQLPILQPIGKHYPAIVMDVAILAEVAIISSFYEMGPGTFSKKIWWMLLLILLHYVQSIHVQQWFNICSGDKCSCDDFANTKELEWGQWLLLLLFLFFFGGGFGVKIG